MMLLQTTTDHAVMPEPAVRAIAFERLAVICRDCSNGFPWHVVSAQNLATSLERYGLIHFDYFRVAYDCEKAAAQLAAAFEAIAAPSTQRRYDAILVVGGPDITVNIDALHRVLVPCIRQARLPVLTALGPDDGNTILGDIAWQVYPDPQALLSFVAAAVREPGLVFAEKIVRVRSLAGFLLTEQAIESKILMQAALRPALEKCHAREQAKFDALTIRANRVVEILQLRLVREEAHLEQSRARIGIALAHAQARSSGRKTGRALHALRLTLLLSFVAIVAALWLWTSGPSTVFYSGCILVLLSALYVAASNRITDQTESWRRG